MLSNLIHLPFVHTFSNLEWLTTTNINLEQGEGHHLIKVLRKRKGEHLILFDGRGGIREAVIVDDRLPVRVEMVSDAEKIERDPKIVLLQGLTNEVGVMDDVIRSATELGIDAFYPMLTERSEKMRWTAEKFSRKQKRWRQIALEACKQSKNPFLPDIHEISIFDTFIENIDIKVLCSLEKDVALPIEYFEDESVKTLLKRKDACVGLFIGPEGGFSSAEVQKIKSAGWTPLRLSNNVLRVATAVNVALGLVQHMVAS